MPDRKCPWFTKAQGIAYCSYHLTCFEEKGGKIFPNCEKCRWNTASKEA